MVEYGQMERVGSSETQRVDVRLVAATNVDLRALAQEGKFRQDLLDRLSFEVIVLPPLRQRKEDIPLLAEHFARPDGARVGAGVRAGVRGAGAARVERTPLPGNVRELKNVVERMVYRTPARTIDEIVFDPFDGGEAECGMRNAECGIKKSAESEARSAENRNAELDEKLNELPLEEAVAALEAARIARALEACRFNQRKAAERLGLSYHQFRGYYRKYREKMEWK